VKGLVPITLFVITAVCIYNSAALTKLNALERDLLDFLFVVLRLAINQPTKICLIKVLQFVALCPVSFGRLDQIVFVPRRRQCWLPFPIHGQSQTEHVNRLRNPV